MLGYVCFGNVAAIEKHIEETSITRFVLLLLVSDKYIVCLCFSSYRENTLICLLIWDLSGIYDLHPKSYLQTIN